MNMHDKGTIGSIAMTAAILLAVCTAEGQNSPLPPAAESAEAVTPLAVGATVPNVILTGTDGQPVVLREQLDTPVALVFYRGGWCPYCNLQLAGLQEIEDDLQALGVRILAVSPDLPENLRSTVEKESLAYTLLSDSAMAAARAFGIAFRVDDATIEKYKGYKIDLEAASGEKHHLLPVPAVFIIGTDGRIKFVYANADYKVRLEPAKMIEAARDVLSGTLVLPPPRREGGKPLLSALAVRHSTREFSDRPIPTQLLSDLLWAAFGVNRPESGNRTAPSSYNWQDVTLYVFTAKGVWTYDASGHALATIKTGDHRKLAGLQSYVWEAPLNLVYVSDQTLMRQGDEVFSDDYKTLISGIDVGHISQNVYLFCASEGLGAVARASVDAKAFAEAFNLPAGHKVVLGQTIGFPAAL